MDSSSGKTASILVHPCNSLLLTSFRGLRNGVYYGTKVRLLHALVMSILFKKGKISERIISILKLTYEHASNLGLYVFSYKFLTYILSKLQGKVSVLRKTSFNAFISGLICGYIIFRKETPINQQITLYLLSRIVIGGASKLAKIGKLPNRNFFALLTAICWGVVMFLFEDDPTTLQPSLKLSMDYLYRESDYYNDWKDFVPFKIPEFIVKLFKQ
eukprot:TRINITY_DN2410_c0_g2_i1.p1 TRINITY_DN2410_c0_g2~~TRINITY_DN2410_c0_g2_i1.p1  ORF type:complete len:215 (-),score=4.55 TRINITY_DN2410_c0_g2_i1:175-819(-)